MRVNFNAKPVLCRALPCIVLACALSAPSQAQDDDGAALPPITALQLKRAAPSSAVAFTQSRAAVLASNDGSEVVLTFDVGSKAKLPEGETAQSVDCAPFSCVHFQSWALELRAPAGKSDKPSRVWADGRLGNDTTLRLRWNNLMTGWKGGDLTKRREICKGFLGIWDHLPDAAQKKIERSCDASTVAALRAWAQEPLSPFRLMPDVPGAGADPVPLLKKIAHAQALLAAHEARRAAAAGKPAAADPPAAESAADASLRKTFEALDAFVNLTDDESITKAFGKVAKGAFLLAADASYGTAQTSYLTTDDKGEWTSYDKRQASTGVHLNLGWIPSRLENLLIQLRVGSERRVKEGDDAGIHCLPQTSATSGPSCVNGLLEKGAQARTTTFGMSARLLLPRNIGVAFNLSKVKGGPRSWDLPIYFVPDKDGALLGGLVFSGGGGAKPSIGVFVGVPFE